MKVSAVIPDDIVVLKERAKEEDRSLGAVRRALADHIARPAADEDVTATPPSATDGKDGDGR